MNKRGNRMSVDESELNLIPIMGVMIVLIPMILFTFSFDQLRVQKIATPRLGASAASAGKQQDQVPLKLALHISRSGFQIKVNEAFDDLSFPDIPKRSFQVVKAPGEPPQPMEEYDYPRLYSVLRDLKEQERFSEENTIDLSAEMDIPWEIVATTLDCVRVKLDTQDFRSLSNYETALEAYRHAKPLMETAAKADDDKVLNPKPQSMFPNIVFTVAEVVN